MKNVFFALVLMLTSSLTEASNLNDRVALELRTTSKTETTLVEIGFDSLEDFNAFDPLQLNFYDDECEASISVTVSVGVGATYVSATVSATGIPCDKVGETTKKLKADALAAIK